MNKSLCVLALAVSCLLGGCASINQLALPLSGTPATSSLVVVVCDATMLGVFDLRTSQKVEGGVLARTSGSRGFNGREVFGLLVFSDVPPGEYYLARVDTSWHVGNQISHRHFYAVPPDKFVIKTKLGEPKFLGVVALEEVRKLHEQGVNFALRPGKEAEAETWEKFIRLYRGHPWADEAQKRISELRQ